MKNFVYKTSNNRTIMLSSAESDCEYSYRRCSYVRSNESSLQIGCILMLKQLHSHMYLGLIMCMKTVKVNSSMYF